MASYPRRSEVHLGSSKDAAFWRTNATTAKARAAMKMNTTIAQLDPCEWRKIVLPAATPTRYAVRRSEEHTSELQSLIRTSYAVYCLNTTFRSDLKSRDTTLGVHVAHVLTGEARDGHVR